MNALRTVFSGVSEPTDTTAYQLWADTSEEILKIRNTTDTGWTFVISLSESDIKVITASYTMLVEDAGAIILADASSADLVVNLLPAATAGEGVVISIKKTDSTTNRVTITPNASELIDERSNYVEQVEDETIILRSTGSGWVIVNMYLPSVVKTISDSHTTAAREDDKVIFAIELTGVSRSFFLPAVSDVSNGFSITIKKTDSTAFFILLRADGTELIDGVSTLQITDENQTMTIVSDGTGWLIVGEVGRSFATSSEMISATSTTTSVSPSTVQYSPYVNQVALTYSSSTQTSTYSRGVSSITLSGSGTLVITFSSAFSSAGYTPVVTAMSSAAVAKGVMVRTIAESSIMLTSFTSSTGTSSYVDAICLIITGDLA